MQEQKIETEFGTIWTASNNPSASNKSSPALLFIHGNAVDSRIFNPLLKQPQLNDNYKLIVYDFPGHGCSGDAPDPDKSYFQYAYAEAALRVLQHYKVETVIPVGWSLGGHVALELFSVLETPMNTTNIRAKGLVITGTAPVPKQKLVGMQSGTDISALFNPDASEEALRKCASVFTNSSEAPAWLEESVLRTNRVAPKTMVVKFLEGKCSDQVEIVKGFKDGQIAVINGEHEPIADLGYCDDLFASVPSLWKGKCVRIPGQRHTPFYDEPEVYVKVLLEYLKDSGF